MDETTTWVVFGAMLVGGVVFGLRQMKALRPQANETQAQYFTRLYGDSFLLRPGERIAHMSPCSLYRGALVPEQSPSLGAQLSGVAARAVKSIGAAAVGVDLSYRDGVMRIAITDQRRLVLTIERGVENFVPEDWTACERVLTDLEAFGKPADGRPPLGEGGLADSWQFMLLVDESPGRRRGLWVDKTFALELCKWRDARR